MREALGVLNWSGFSGTWIITPSFINAGLTYKVHCSSILWYILRRMYYTVYCVSWLAPREHGAALFLFFSSGTLHVRNKIDSDIPA